MSDYPYSFPPCNAYIIEENGNRYYCEQDHDPQGHGTHIGERTQEQYDQLLAAWVSHVAQQYFEEERDRAEEIP